MGSTSKQITERSVSAALVAVLAPMCVDKFRQGPDGVSNLAEFKKVSSWMQDSYIQKGGWATFPGMDSPDLAIARACATLLAAK